MTVKALNSAGLIDLRGKAIGQLTVKQRVRVPTGSATRWKCVCVCGKVLVVAHNCLIRKSPKTHCGCQNSKGPGALYPLVYGVWCMMLVRCSDPKHVAYASYGGRGIKVCERWKTFENFRLDMGDRKSRKFSLDRIDPDGDYEPGNVRWSDQKTQARNKRKSLFLEHPHIAGKMIPAAEVAEILGVRYQTMRALYIKEGKWPTGENNVPTTAI